MARHEDHDLFDELFRQSRAFRKEEERRWREGAAERDLLQEERRVAAWLERPEWRTFWSDEAGDWRVPPGWPEGGNQPTDRPPTDGRPEPAPDTFMHRMLPKR